MHIRIICVFAMLAALAAALAAPAVGVELLANPGWESGAPDTTIANNPLTAYGWTYYRTWVDPGSSTSVNLRPENKPTFTNQKFHSGANALRSSSNASTMGREQRWIIYQDVPAVPGGSYTASAWILARDLTADNTGFDYYPTDSVSLWIQELDASDGLVVDHPKESVTAANTEYEQRTLSFNANAATTKIRFIIEVSVKEPFNKTIITIDDCSLDGPVAVFDLTGTVTSGATVISEADVTCTTASRTLSTTTNDSGVYSFAGLTPADNPVTVRVSKSGYYAQRKTRTLMGNTTLDFDLHPVNLLASAGFDDVAANVWDNGWNTDTNRGAVVNEALSGYSPANYDSGEGAVALYNTQPSSPPGPGDAKIWQTVSVQPNAAYTASCRFTAVGSQWGGVEPRQYAYMFIKEFDADGNLVLEHANISPTVWSGWETLTDSFTTTSSTAIIQIGAYASVVETTGGTNRARAVFDTFVLSGPAGPGIPMLLGVVKSGGSPVGDAKVELTGLSISTTTTGSGHYELNAPTYTALTVRASKSGYYAQRKGRTLRGPDIVSFDLIAVGSNLLANAGHDDLWYSGWSYTLGGEKTQVTSESGVKTFQAPFYDSGEQAVRIYSDAGNEWGEIHQDQPVQPGSTYTARVRFRPGYRNPASVWGTDPNQVAALYVQEYDSSGALVLDHPKVYADFVNYTRDEWQTLSETFTTQPTTAVVRIGGYAFLVDNHNNTVGRAIFDTFELNGAGVTPTGDIPDVKALPEQTVVYLANKVVTASFGTAPNAYCYIEEPDRSSGIKVTVPANTTVPSAGHTINVFGKVETVAGEKQITCVALNRTSSTTVPAPVGLNNRATGGEGLSAVGLRVKAWGKVDDIGGNPFTIDDGSGLNLKVYGPSGYTAVPGDYLAITGALGAETIDGEVIPVLRAVTVDKMN